MPQCPIAGDTTALITCLGLLCRTTSLFGLTLTCVKLLQNRHPPLHKNKYCAVFLLIPIDYVTMPTVATQATAKYPRSFGAYYIRVAKNRKNVLADLHCVSRRHKSTVTVTPDNCRMAFGLFQSLYVYTYRLQDFRFQIYFVIKGHWPLTHYEHSI